MSLVFLPGASGRREFWQPAATQLRELGPCTIVSWPGLGGARKDPGVREVRQLPELVRRELGAGAHVVAQSMGCVAALLTALSYPELVHSLVLVAPTGGIDMQAAGAVDWRAGADEWQPADAPNYFALERTDYSLHLAAITCPVLLLSGGQDPLSPPAVADKFAELLPNARQAVLTAGEHDLAEVHAPWVVSQIRDFLAGTSQS